MAIEFFDMNFDKNVLNKNNMFVREYLFFTDTLYTHLFISYCII